MSIGHKLRGSLILDTHIDLYDMISNIKKWVAVPETNKHTPKMLVNLGPFPNAGESFIVRDGLIAWF